MFVAIDIGNSNIVVGIYKEGVWIHLWRWETHLAETEMYYTTQIADAFLEAGIHVNSGDQIGMSSVVPEITSEMQDALEKLFKKKVFILDPKQVRSIIVSDQKAQEIGSDLVANAIAAYQKYQAPCIIVDFGTALTFTVVSSEGRIVGVNILPGLKTAIRSLFGNTAKLPEVPIILPDSKVGTNTVTAIQSGVLWGYTGLVREMIRMIREEIQVEMKVAATGGLSSILETLHMEFDDVLPFLTLDGLRIELGAE